MKSRIAKHEITGRLADFRTIDHQSEMARFHIFAASIETMRHGHMQAGLMAITAGFDAGLQVSEYGSVLVGIGMAHLFYSIKE